MPWNIILYGVVLPLSLAGLLLAIFSSFRMQHAAKAVPLRARLSADCVDQLEALPEWRKYRRLVWIGVGLVTGACLLPMLMLAIATALKSHQLVTLNPTFMLPLSFAGLPFVLASNQRRQRLMKRAGVTISAGVFSIENMRKLEALKRTPEWRSVSRQALLAGCVVAFGACLYAAAVIVLLTGHGS